jgi:hypothetical protein
LLSYVLAGWLLHIPVTAVIDRGKRGKKLVIVTIGLTLVLPLLLGSVDYSKARELKHPIFSLCIAHYKDGGTRKHLGLGYILTCHHKIVHDLPLDGTEGQYGFQVGSSIKFWFGVHCEKTWFVPR